MLAGDIIGVIERRYAKFRGKCHSPSAANLSEADLVHQRITDEYDSLMAEIQALRKAKRNPHVPFPVIRDYPENRTEEWILGDQGQLGG